VKLTAKQISLVLAGGAIGAGAGQWVCAAERSARTQYDSDLPRAPHFFLNCAGFRAGQRRAGGYKQVAR